jgi:hypothetical protein
MKTVIFLIVLWLLPFKLSAQLEPGTFLIGGGLSAYSNQDEYSGDLFYSDYEIDELSFSFYPEVGYFVIENLALGLNAKLTVSGLTYGTSTQNFPESNANSFEYLMGPYIRYYYPIKPFALYAELNYQFGEMTQTLESTFIDTSGQSNQVENEDNSELSMFSPAIGIIYFINNSIGLSAALRYENGTRKFISEPTVMQGEYSYERKFSGFIFLVGLQIHLNFSEPN